MRLSVVLPTCNTRDYGLPKLPACVPMALFTCDDGDPSRERWDLRGAVPRDARILDQ